MAFSNYLEDEITGWINGTTFDAAPTSTFIQLYSQNPTESGSATGALYTRVSVAAGGWTRGTNGVGTLTNTNVITITSSAPSGATATHFAVFDSSTGGNMLFYGSLTAPQVIGAGDEVKFNASTLVLIVSVLLSNLLDLYPNAAAAYSLRKLRTAYAGSAIRVRRSSDDEEQDIGFDVNGNLDTGALLAFCLVGNGFVTRWYDQSGNARNATQTTLINQPKIVNAGVLLTKYGKPHFDFATQSLRVGTQLVLQSNNSIFTVFNSSATGSFGFINYMSNPNDSPEILLGRGDLADFYIASGYVWQGTNISAITGGLYSQIITTGVTGTIWRNSVQIVTASRTGTFSTQSKELTIGQYIAGGGVYRNGNISELVVYNANQTSNKTGIETNINSYYGIY